MKIIIIGAGIGGLSTAACLKRVGIECEVWERAPHLDAAGTGLNLGSNAVKALRSLDIDLGLDTVRGASARTMTVWTPGGRILAEPHLADLSARLGAPSVSIHRKDLQEALLNEAEGVPIHLGARAIGFDSTEDGVRVQFDDGRVAEGDAMVGADGIRSVVRSTLHGQQPTRYAGFVCWLATTRYRIQPGSNAHYWGRGKRFGIHDIGQGRVYWWGTVNMPEDRARNWDGDKNEILAAFDGWPAETKDLIDTTSLADIVAVPAQDRPFLDTWGKGRVTLLGDAAHPMLPSLGQGGGSTIEDAVFFARSLASSADVEHGLRRYEDMRRERTRTLVEVSYDLHRTEQHDGLAWTALRNAFMKVRGNHEMTTLFDQVLTLPFLPELTTTGTGAR